MSDANWIPTDHRLPTENELVDTISPGGIAVPLKRSGGLWFHADGGMYVYYVPRFWRPRDATGSR